VKTITVECPNEDFCPPGTTHKYPAADEVVTVWAATEVREVSSEEMHEILPGQKVTVIRHHPDGHEVIARIASTDVWLCIDDVDGLDNSEPPSILGPNDDHPMLGL